MEECNGSETYTMEYSADEIEVVDPCGFPYGSLMVIAMSSNF